MAVTYEAIATQTLGSTASSVTFSSIPQTYTDVVYSIMTPTSAGTNTTIQFNGDSTTIYSHTQLYGDGSSANSLRGTDQSASLAGVSNGTASIRGNIMNYSNSTTYKTYLARGGAGGGTYLDAVVGLWRNTAAITSITFLASWPVGTVLTIYGIKAA